MCDGRTTRLHELTATPGIHILLARDADLSEPDSLGPRVRMHRLTSQPGRDVLAVRPNGYLGSDPAAPTQRAYAPGSSSSEPGQTTKPDQLTPHPIAPMGVPSTAAVPRVTTSVQPIPRSRKGLPDRRSYGSRLGRHLVRSG